MTQLASQQDIIQQIMSQGSGGNTIPRQIPNFSGDISNFLTAGFGNPEEQEGARQAQQAEFARMQQSNTRIAMANAEMKRRLMMDKLTAATAQAEIGIAGKRETRLGKVADADIAASEAQTEGVLGTERRAKGREEIYREGLSAEIAAQRAAAGASDAITQRQRADYDQIIATADSTKKRAKAEAARAESDALASQLALDREKNYGLLIDAAFESELDSKIESAKNDTERNKLVNQLSNQLLTEAYNSDDPSLMLSVFSTVANKGHFTPPQSSKLNNLDYMKENFATMGALLEQGMPTSAQGLSKMSDMFNALDRYRDSDEEVLVGLIELVYNAAKFPGDEFGLSGDQLDKFIVRSFTPNMLWNTNEAEVRRTLRMLEARFNPTTSYEDDGSQQRVDPWLSGQKSTFEQLIFPPDSPAIKTPKQKKKPVKKDMTRIEKRIKARFEASVARGKVPGYKGYKSPVTGQTDTALKLWNDERIAAMRDRARN